MRESLRLILLTTIVSLILVIAGACGDGGGRGAGKNTVSDGTPQPTTATPTLSATPSPTATPVSPVTDTDGDGAGVSTGTFLSTFSPFTLLEMGSVGGGQAAFPSASQGVNESLEAVLLTSDDLPVGFSNLFEFAISTPTDYGAVEMAATMLATGDLGAEDFGAMVMSAAITLPPEAMEELGDFSEFEDLLQADFDEMAAELDEYGMGFADLRLLDSSGLGDSGFGMRMEMDFSGLFDAFELPDGGNLFGGELQDIELGEEEGLILGGITMEIYSFLHGDRMLMVMVMWPTDEAPGVDGRELAEVMDAKASAAF